MSFHRSPWSVQLGSMDTIFFVSCCLPLSIFYSSSAVLRSLSGLRRQFDSHLFCLDTKAQNKLEILQEWHEYLKKRSEVELEYTRALERTSDRFLERVNRMKTPPKG